MSGHQFDNLRNYSSYFNSVLLKVTFLFSFFIVSCSSVETKIEYFEDGKTIKSKSDFVDGIKNGVEIKYYKDGKTKSIKEWRKGKLQGAGKEFYADGSASVLTFLNGKPVGEANFFDVNNKLREIQYYDSSGVLIEVKKYDVNGDQVRNAEFILPWLRSDTVKLGDTIHLTLKIANVSDFRLNSGELIIGKVNREKSFEESSVKPIEFAEVFYRAKSNNNYYSYKTIPTTKGIGSIQGELLFNLSKDPKVDSLSWFPFSLSYFVK